MAKWIAVKKKEWDHAREMASQVSPLKDMHEELKVQLEKAHQRYNALLESPDSVSYMSKDTHHYLCEQLGVPKDSGLFQPIMDIKADAEKWRAMPKEAQLLPPINRADAELGALVRKMPETFFVYHGEDGWYLKDGYGRTSGFCETPEQAFERGPTLD
jgi:hypothetical protein